MEQQHQLLTHLENELGPSVDNILVGWIRDEFLGFMYLNEVCDWFHPLMIITFFAHSCDVNVCFNGILRSMVILNYEKYG